VRRRRWLSRGLAVSGLAGALTLLTRPLARAGTDVFSNIAPASPLGSAANFLRYPLTHYGLDQHFTVISAGLTGVSVSGLLPEIAWWFASMVWAATVFAAWGVIELFAFAFSLDLVNGSSATGGAGALGPVSQAIHQIYASAFGAPWLVLALSAVAIWAMWKALVQRRYSETAGALAMSLIYIVIAFFFVAEPGLTIGQASRWTNEMSQAFLSISDHGDPSGGTAATADDADQLWGLLVERPWSVLEFGGLEHCAIDGTGDEDSDPQSAPVRPLSRDSAQDAELARRLTSGTEVSAEGKTCFNNANKYSSHFLRFGFGTDERSEEYDALDHGDAEKLPEADDEKAGYHLGVADKPATDAMEAGGQYQRFLLAVVVAVGETGAFILLGSLTIGVILSQVLLLLLLAFSPVALVAAVIPGGGHEFFKSWLQKLAGYLLRKAAYSLVLAILLSVNAAIAAATSQLGWLFAFGLQAVFFWTVLIQRRTLTNGIIGIATGARVPGREVALDAFALYAGARVAAIPRRGAGAVGGAAYSRLRRKQAKGRRRHASFGGVSVSHSAGQGGSTTGAGQRSAAGANQTEAKGAPPSGEAVAASPAKSQSSTAGSGKEASGGTKAESATPAKAGGEPSSATPGDESPAAGGGSNATPTPSSKRRSAGDDRPRPDSRQGPDEEGGSPRRGRALVGDQGEDPEAPRRSKPSARQRPDGRTATDSTEAGEAGTPGTPTKRSELSDELRAEREQSKTKSAPSSPSSAGTDTDAAPSQPSPSEPDLGAPLEWSTALRRRRRLRLWSRRK
jgi:hypothetical protein